jgi:hypothetical protein
MRHLNAFSNINIEKIKRNKIIVKLKINIMERDFTEEGIIKRKKLEQEGISAFFCDKCHKQFSQQDKKDENYCLDYAHAYTEREEEGCQEESLLVETKHKNCPKKHVELEENLEI